MWDFRKQIGVVNPFLHLEFQGHCFSSFSVLCSGLSDSLGVVNADSVAADDRETAVKCAEMFGISQHLETPFIHLSQGQQRLVLLARAMIKKPQLLLLDEPTHGLDTATRQNFLGFIQEVASSPPPSFAPPTTVLHVTHHQDEVLPCMTHELRLSSDGQIESFARRGGAT